MKVEYRIVDKFYDKDRRWYLVIKKIDHGNWLFNWLFNSHWGYINSDGEYIYGPWINAYTTTNKIDAEALIEYLKSKSK